MDAVFIDFFPTDLEGQPWEKSAFTEQVCVKFTKQSYAENITTCHHWHFRVNDWRKNKKGLQQKEKPEPIRKKRRSDFFDPKKTRGDVFLKKKMEKLFSKKKMGRWWGWEQN